MENSEDFPAESTQLTAQSQTKDLHQAFVGKETEPEEVAVLALGADKAAKAEHGKQVLEQNGKVIAIHKQRIHFQCIIALYLDDTSLNFQPCQFLCCFTDKNEKNHGQSTETEHQ